MTAVRRGDGIPYTTRAFFRDDPNAGTLAELFSEPLFGVYYLAAPQKYQRPEARTFLKWLRSKGETAFSPGCPVSTNRTPDLNGPQSDPRRPCVRWGDSGSSGPDGVAGSGHSNGGSVPQGKRSSSP